MIKCMMPASKNKTIMTLLPVLLLVIMQENWHQPGFESVGASGQVATQTQASVSNTVINAQLKIKVVEQRYCRATTANHNILRIILSVELLNSSKHPLIFFKSGYRIAEYAISKTWEDALASKHETKASLFGSTQVFRLGPNNSLQEITALIDTPTPSKDFFLIIPPGESYKGEESLTIPIYVNESKRRPDNLTEGEHFLQVTLATWPDVDIPSAKLRERWKGYGYLYSEGITSVPASFTFFHENNIEICPK